MYPPEFDYMRAGSVSEAVSLLGKHRGAKLLAGGHSLIPILKLRQARPTMLIDIGRIAELKGIQKVDGSLRIGALTTHAMLAASQEVPSALSEAASLVADVQVRNRGTIGGNVSHADPASDLPTVLTALGATFHITGPGGQRSVGTTDFFKGMFETGLSEDEILTAIQVPIPAKGSGSAYVKLSNQASGYAILGVATVIRLEGGKCTEARVVLGGLTPVPTRSTSTEAALVGKTLNEAAITTACKAVEMDLGMDLLADLHASAEYRKAMAPVYTRRVIKATVARAGM